MKNLLKYVIVFEILLLGMANTGHAFDLDETVDDEIRKNYNDTKLLDDTGFSNQALERKTKKTEKNSDEELPALPSITKYPDSTKKSNTLSGSIQAPPKVIIPYKGGNIKVHKGTVFNVTSSNAISDWQSRGTKVKFVTKTQTSGKNYTIPAWTSFNGEIVESHQPQITCNGGLVSVRIYSMTYKGQVIPINGYITRANDKKIFFNDIKGDRTYLKTMWKKGGWGRNIFNRMMTLTVKLGADGGTLVLSPFPALYGTVCLGLNTLTSPITAFFSKGSHISIPAGSQFKIKLSEDIYID